MKGLLRLMVLLAIGVWLWMGGLSMLTAAAGAVAGFVAGLGWLLLGAVAVGVLAVVAFRWWRRRRKDQDTGGAAPLAQPLAWQGGANASAVNSVTIHVGGSK